MFGKEKKAIHCIRCRKSKTRLEFPKSEENILSSRVCKDCKEIENKVRNLKKGDFVIYKAPNEKSKNDEMIFLRLEGNGKRTYVICRPKGSLKGETKIYIGDLIVM